VGHLAARAHTDFLLAYGPESVHTRDAAAADGVPAWHFADRAGAEAKLREILQPGDVILLKGSHSMAVNGIIDTVFKTL
jgi:UDP-N-acetylmuramoyl-tripeptide--D-alanyl-D-alanine ligase